MRIPLSAYLELYQLKYRVLFFFAGEGAFFAGASAATGILAAFLFAGAATERMSAFFLAGVRARITASFSSSV